MVKEIKVYSCGKQPYHSGLGDLRKRHMVNHNGTHKTLTLETTLQWDALGRMGQSFGLTEERTCQEKIDSIISVYIQFSDFDQACEVVLPLTESRASTWANGVNGRLLNLPHFSLNSEGLAPQIHKNVKTAYEFWRMKEICDKGLHFHKWDTISRWFSNYCHCVRDYWFLVCPTDSTFDAWKAAHQHLFKNRTVTKDGEVIQKPPRVRKFDDFNKAMKGLMLHAVRKRRVATIKALENDLVAHPTRVGMFHFPEEEESTCLELLREHLIDIVKVQLQPLEKDMSVLSKFKDFLKSPKATDQVKQDLRFIDKVFLCRPTQKRINKEKFKHYWHVFYLVRKYKKAWIKKEELDTEEEKKKNEEQRKKRAEAAARKMKESMDAIGKMLNNEGPTLQHTDPPSYSRPSQEWIDRQRHTVKFIRDLVDSVGDDCYLFSNIERDVDNWTSWYSDAFAIVVECAHIMKDEDNRDVIDHPDFNTPMEQLMTWVPQPWQRDFTHTMICFFDILTTKSSDPDKQKRIDDTVTAEVKKYKKKTDAAWLKRIIANIKKEAGDNEIELMDVEPATRDPKDMEAINMLTAMANRNKEMDAATAILNLLGSA